MKIRNALRSYGVISTMLLCMIGFILLHLGHRDLAFSEKENRVLQQRPAADMAGQPYSMAAFRRRVKHGSGISLISALHLYSFTPT